MSALIETARMKKFNVPMDLPRDTPFRDRKAEFSAGDDGRTLIILRNSGESPVTVTVKAGSGFAGAADLQVPVKESGGVCLCLESGRFSRRGKITAEADGDGVTARVIELP